MGAARRALVIGVGEFSTRSEFSGFTGLSFAEEMAGRAAQGYARLGFSLVEPVRNPDRGTRAELLDTMGQPGEATVLHYVGHGASGRGPGTVSIATLWSVNSNVVGRTYFLISCHTANAAPPSAHTMRSRTTA